MQVTSSELFFMLGTRLVFSRSYTVQTVQEAGAEQSFPKPS